MIIPIPANPVPLFIKNTPFYGYRNPHYKPKTVSRPSQVYNGNPFTFLVTRGPTGGYRIKRTHLKPQQNNMKHTLHRQMGSMIARHRDELLGLTHWGRDKMNAIFDFADDISKCIFLNENVWIPIKISLKYVPTGPIPALV